MPKKVKILLICIIILLALSALLTTCDKINDSYVNDNYKNSYSKYIENMTPEEKRHMLGLPTEGFKP